MPNGFVRGSGPGFRSRGGMGFGFRGSSPPWPYVGLGRGGLPRCCYFFSGTGDLRYQPPGVSTFGYGTYQGPVRGEEVDYLRQEAEAIRTRLDEIESRMRDLGTKEG